MWKTGPAPWISVPSAVKNTSSLPAVISCCSSYVLLLRWGVPRSGVTAEEGVRPVRSNARRWALAAAGVLAITALVRFAVEDDAELQLPPTAAGVGTTTSLPPADETQPVAALAADRPSL